MLRIPCYLVVIGMLTSAPAWAQFNSGSNGSDGALTFASPGTYDFDPVALGKDLDGDNIFHFTTIDIPAGVTVRLRATKLRNSPVVWLATGAVNIAGTLTVSGADGNPLTGNHTPAEPGPGGYAGGVGQRVGSAATPAAGPGGGLAIVGNCGCGASHAAGGGCGGGVTPPAYGNVLLIPLRGGSGGSGGSVNGNVTGGNGGAGGGAIQIASSSTITVSGSILADGGVGQSGQFFGGGAGSGGAIHLQAQTITGTGLIRANGGAGGGGNNCNGAGGFGTTGSVGRIRIDATSNTFSGNVQPPATFGAPFNALPSAVPSVRLVSVNGVAVPSAPTGSFTAPDVTINIASGVTINIAAANVPLGTVVKLYLASETGTDQLISCAPLSGTVANSTAACTATFPLGTTATLARAVW